MPMRFPISIFVSLFASVRSFSSQNPTSNPTSTRSISYKSFTPCLPFSRAASARSMSIASATTSIPSWIDLQSNVAETPVGKALNVQVELRKQGRGSAHVHNQLRWFDSGPDEKSNSNKPPIKLYRDHAGWCPYCQKTMLLIEEKRIPIEIELVPMRSYGDKPAEFTSKVPGGLLPAIQINNGNGQIITESSVIMELLDQWHTPEEGYKPMMPRDEAGQRRFQMLSSLERDLFRWWCTLLFRPELPGNPLSKLMGGGGGGGESSMSGSMQGFLDCMKTVDSELQKTKGPWFFDEQDYPTMIDFVFVSHIERMLASCAYWKGLNLRDPKWGLKGVNAWLDAFEKREHYLAFKSDYYTHVKDIPPQYGPGYSGGFETDRQAFSKAIEGKDGSWTLPLSHDDPLQPLYRGPPLPLCVLEAAGIVPDDDDGSYESADRAIMAQTCRQMAAWKLAGNGVNVAKFAARGGPSGSKNPRKSFGAELADPYAESDGSILEHVDEALRVICLAMIHGDGDLTLYVQMLKDAVVPSGKVKGVVSSLAYLRDRIGCPRDLPLASGRYFRAYLNWGIDALS